MPTYTLAAAVEAELEIRKSRFLAFVIPVDDRAAAMQELVRLRERHSGAAHVCWALMAGGQSGMSDDGEPSGTAGRPMLEVLRHHELEEVLAVVVRYFGGIKLGAGGLARAYTDAVASALAKAERVQRIAWAEIEVDCDYADESRLRRWLDQQSHLLVKREPAERLRLHIRVPADLAEAAKGTLLSLTQGRTRVIG